MGAAPTEIPKAYEPKLVEDKIEGDIAYLRVPAFDAGVTKQIHDDLVQLRQFRKRGDISENGTLRIGRP